MLLCHNCKSPRTGDLFKSPEQNCEEDQIELIYQCLDCGDENHIVDDRMERP